MASQKGLVLGQVLFRSVYKMSMFGNPLGNLDI